MLMRFFSWWYGKGLAWRAEQILDGIERSVDTFSLGLLLKTWFAPFRQIDAGAGAGGSLDARIRRALDKLLSRFIGALLRTFVMIIGVFYIAGKTIFGLLGMILWLFAPILPIVFVVIFITGWTPKVLPMLRDEFSKVNFLKSSLPEKSQNKKDFLDFGKFSPFGFLVSKT